MTDVDPSARTAAPDISEKGVRRAAVAGAVGTLIEWYDYGLFGLAAALYIGPLFFSAQSAIAASLLAFGTFAVGFIARPIGGIVLGHLGDKIGRKPVLIAAVIMMGLATSIMGILPTYAQVGILAPILLVLLRLLQGFGAGAEVAGAFTYIAESTGPRRRVFWISLPMAGVGLAILLSTLVFKILDANLSPADMLGYGWRIPFLLAIPGLVVAIIVRSRLKEAPEFEALPEKAEYPILDLLRRQPAALVAGFFTPTALGLGTYIASTFAVSYAVGTLKVSSSVTLTAVLVGSIVSVPAVLLFGILADRIGAHRVFIFGALLQAAFAFPFFLLLQTRGPAEIILAYAVATGIAWGACGAGQGAVLSDLFDTRHRYTGIATTREVNQALLGGTAPFIAVALLAALDGQPWLVAAYVVISGLFSAGGAIFARRLGAREVPVR